MNRLVGIERLHEFDEIIDVRSPSEFGLDHIPNAINAPVLNDQERAEVGTIYKQVNPFEAKQVGASIVARNIANAIDHIFVGRPKKWKPLIYCWRGGQRSAAMAHILRQIGWNAHQLEGGYKAYRKYVIEELEHKPEELSFVVLCGLTGVGKTTILRELAKKGQQILDLEELANHKGSLLGKSTTSDQPSQKHFETLLWENLKNFQPSQVIFTESESRKIGNLRIPEKLMNRIRLGDSIRIEATIDKRIDLIIREYPHFLENPNGLKTVLRSLQQLHSNKLVREWENLINKQNWREFVRDIMIKHYDPAYQKSSIQNFPKLSSATTFQVDDYSDNKYEKIATDIINSINKNTI
jgi:tRNA 2-selenouridine synthase